MAIQYQYKKIIVNIQTISTLLALKVNKKISETLALVQISDVYLNTVRFIKPIIPQNRQTYCQPCRKLNVLFIVLMCSDYAAKLPTAVCGFPAGSMGNLFSQLNM
jgi:hypothetical protein